MYKIELNVPPEVNYLSDWTDFENQLPGGKVILNKEICGCGCTEYFLNGNKPVILASPRRELINCKLKSKRIPNLYYYDRSDQNITVADSKRLLVSYLNRCKAEGLLPKIIVTYDSSGGVFEVLNSFKILGNFTIVIDEFTCIFTDVKFKGQTEIEFVRNLMALSNNIYFISATPIEETILDTLDDFKNLPYVCLRWCDNRKDVVNISWRPMKSSTAKIREIISKYQKRGYFLSKTTSGQEVFSKEAVFFVNSVKTIVRVIEKMHLTEDNTLIICSNNDENKTSLNRVGFTIGHLSSEEEYKEKNKTFTFVTRASFEGADFYSDQSTTYIFADMSRDCMCLDISVDLPQIIGRCRNANNPFRLNIQYYYKTKTDIGSVDDLIRMAEEKKEKTTSVINFLHDALHDPRMKATKMVKDTIYEAISDAQEKTKYSKNYIDVVESSDGSNSFTYNQVAYAADLRAISIKKNQYSTKYAVHNSLKAAGLSQPGTNLVVENFVKQFALLRSEVDQSKLYCDTLDSHPELKMDLDSLPVIPFSIKQTYNVLGPEKIKANSYRIGSLKDEVNFYIKRDEIREVLKTMIVVNSFYDNNALKVIMAKALVSCGIKHKKISASDIQDFFPLSKNGNITDRKAKKRRWGWFVYE